MRYVVLGAGAIGGGVAALLHEAGFPTTVVARGATLVALQDSGLRLAVGHDERTVRVPVVDSLAAVSWTEDTALLLAVKSQQTAGVQADLVAHVPAHVPVLCLQNGVANERLLLRHRPEVHGVVVMMPASSLEPGSVVIHSLGLPGLLDVGRYPDGTDRVDDAVAEDLRLAGFDSVPRPDVMAWKHRKLLLNLGNAVDAGYRPGADADRLVARLREEGEAVLEAAGVPVVTEDEDLARRGQLLRPLVRRDEAGSSTWQSLARGAVDTEVDQLNGEVVLLGRLHGVPTPANAVVQSEVNRLARAGSPPRSLDAAEALAASSLD